MKKEIPQAFVILTYLLLGSWLIPCCMFGAMFLGGSPFLFIFSILLPTFVAVLALIFLKETDAKHWARKEGFSVQHVYTLCFVNIVLGLLLCAIAFVVIMLIAISHMGPVGPW